MNLNDDRYHNVEYKCQACGAALTIDDTSLPQIAVTFKEWGWLNIAVNISPAQTDYVVYCPDCNERETTEINTRLFLRWGADRWYEKIVTVDGNQIVPVTEDEMEVEAEKERAWADYCDWEETIGECLAMTGER